MTPGDLTPGQRAVLDIVRREKRIGPKNIARMLGHDRKARAIRVIRTLGELEKLGLVKKFEAVRNKRTGFCAPLNVRGSQYDTVWMLCD